MIILSKTSLNSNNIKYEITAFLSDRSVLFSYFVKGTHKLHMSALKGGRSPSALLCSRPLDYP